jgi:hypothetical protein
MYRKISYIYYVMLKKRDDTVKRISLFIIMLILGGCATAGPRKEPRLATGPKKELVAEMQGSRVYAAIKSQLQRGATVNVMVEYQTSFDGLPQGYDPADFGCDVDAETVIETEKIFLLDAFSKYPCFSVVDRSRIDASFNESKLGMSGVTVPNIQTGAMSGASHLIVIEGKNHFFHIKGKNKDRYTEIKKLLDMQKNVVVGMDKLSEEREVQYLGPRHLQKNDVAEAQQSQQENAALEQLPPIIKAEPAAWPVETIQITGGRRMPPEAAQQPQYQIPQEQLQSAETIEVINQPVQYQQVNRRQRVVRVKKIADWQMERIVKQRYPDMKEKDKKAEMDRFVSKHPEYRQRIMPTVPPHVKTDTP